MKKNPLWWSALVLVTAGLLVVSCATAPVAPTPAKVEAAPAVAKATAPLILADFEDSTREVGTYAGPKSKVTVEYQSALVHGGTQALKVTENTSDWAGALLVLDAEKGNWAAYSQLHFWLYGTKTGDYFNIDLEDAGAEQFRASFANDFQGWKEFTVPFSDFPQRSDYQAPDAKKNRKIDWPLKTVQFFTSSQFKGFLVFDDLSVEP